MPLKVKTIVELRAEAVRKVEAGVSISEVARLCEVSRPTIYEWLRRHRESEGLEDRSRAPLHSPTQTSEWIAARLIAEREKWGFGAKKILQRLREEEPDVAWPARSTADEIYRRAGLTAPGRRRERQRKTPFLRRFEPSKPGELFTVDFKGQFRLKNGRLCYPLTMVDAVSKYVIACEALESTHLEPAWAVMERMFRKWGLPEAVQSDNGPPFGANGSGRLSTISVRLMNLGVRPVFSRPAKPQDNAAHERMHRELKRVATIPPSSNVRDQQKRFASFQTIYNEERPHEGLAMSRPARLWRGGVRPFAEPIAIRYPAWFEVRRVAHSGMLKWPTGDVFVSHALACEEIGLEPMDVDRWNVFFGPFYLGQLDEPARLLV